MPGLKTIKVMSLKSSGFLCIPEHCSAFPVETILVSMVHNILIPFTGFLLMFIQLKPTNLSELVSGHTNNTDVRKDNTIDHWHGAFAI